MADAFHITPAQQLRPRSIAWPLGLGVTLVCLGLLFQVIAITRPLDVLVDRVLDRDDAYYYFVTARNIATLGWSTFDALHDSSGVQLAWTGLLVPLAWAFPGEEPYLRAVLALCLALNALSAFLLYRFCRRIHSPMLGDVALALFAGFLIERWNTLQGMEYSLHIVVLLAIGLSAWRLLVERDDRQAILLGALLAANFWVRLDSAVVSVAVWGVVVLSLVQRSPRRIAGIAALTAVPALSAMAYVGASLVMAGTLLPLSGDVKAYYAQHFFDGYSTSVAIVEMVRAWIKVQLMGPLAIIPANILELSLGEGYYPASKPHQVVLTVFFAAMLLGGIAILRRYGPATPERRLLRLALFILVVGMLQSATCVVVMKDFAHVSRHYYALQSLFWIVWTALLLTIGFSAVAPRLGRLPSAAAVAFGAFCYGQIAFSFFRAPLTDANYAVARLHLSEELNRDLPADAIVGAWNAGVLGYFLHRPVVNLDGLVNDQAFLAVLESGVPLDGYLRDTGVTYLIDHNRRDLTLRFKEARGKDDTYRNGIRWDQVERIGKRGDVYVLRFKG